MQKKYISQGYTLVELLVTLSVFAIVMPMIMNSYDGRPKQREELRSEMVNLLTLFQSARASALSSATVNNSVPEGGYGISMELANDKKIFTVFADLNKNGVYDEGVGTTEKIKDMTVTNPNITFSGIVDSVPKEKINILFFPPNGSSKIYADGTDASEYKDMTLTVSYPGILIETISFNRISGFFERQQIFPSATPTTP
ncbi:MAG: type II secretion system protein [Candidatus Peregrinibacteria bacterium]